MEILYKYLRVVPEISTNVLSYFPALAVALFVLMCGLVAATCATSMGTCW